MGVQTATSQFGAVVHSCTHSTEIQIYVQKHEYTYVYIYICVYIYMGIRCTHPNTKCAYTLRRWLYADAQQHTRTARQFTGPRRAWRCKRSFISITFAAQIFQSVTRSKLWQNPTAMQSAACKGRRRYNREASAAGSLAIELPCFQDPWSLDPWSLASFLKEILPLNCCCWVIQQPGPQKYVK